MLARPGVLAGGGREFGVDGGEGEWREFVADAREAEADARESEADARDEAAGALEQAALRRRKLAAARRADAARRRREWVDGLDPDVRRALYPVAARFADLAGELFGVRDLRGVLERVVRGARGLLEGADAVSIAAETGGRLGSIAATDAVASELDEVQFRASRGPTLDAVRVPGVGLAFAADLGAGTPWVEFARAAGRQGVHSVLSVALFPTGEPPRAGALTFYSRAVGGLADTDHDIAIILAAYAGSALAAVSALESADDGAQHLRRALDHRDVIGQAKGILMERRGLTAEEAFQVLSDTSQRLNVKLRDVAADVADSAGHPDR